MNNPTPTEFFQWLRSHKGHPIAETAHNLRERIRARRRHAYEHDRAAIEAKHWRTRAYHEDEAKKIREVWLPEMVSKFNQIIKGQ